MPTDQLSVPVQERVKLDEEASDSPPGEQRCQPSEECPVGGRRGRTADLSAEHDDLVAEQDHLDCPVFTVEPGGASDISWPTHGEEIGEAERPGRC